MQTDMHYYGTYAIACAAGINPLAAQAIATCAEYVDDSNLFTATLADGIYVEATATAHHPIDAHNIDLVDQCKIWVPFHFLPGNQGESLEERLICIMDSPLAREMVNHNLSFADSDFGLEIMGITAHVYADTFSHYGFSGISSSQNRVQAESIQLNDIQDPNVHAYLVRKFADFKDKFIMGRIADQVGLGHGSVGTYPDRPFLNWNFTYEDGRESGVRENKHTFLEACRQLHRVFTEFSTKRSGLFDGNIRREFGDIENNVSKVLATEGDMDTRIAAWNHAVINGEIFGNPQNTPIPKYEITSFQNDLQNLAGFKHDSIQGTTLFQFLSAAKTHRDFVLDTLLPKYDLSVIYRM